MYVLVCSMKSCIGYMLIELIINILSCDNFMVSSCILILHKQIHKLVAWNDKVSL